MSNPPLVLVDSEDALRREVAALRTHGTPVHFGWEHDGTAGTVCAGTISSSADLQAAVLAAVNGAGIAAHVERSDLLERVFEDLTRVGPVEIRSPTADPLSLLAPDERALLELLAGGSTLGEAARALHVSRRTADRRLAGARRKLGVSTRAEAVVLAQRRAT